MQLFDLTDNKRSVLALKCVLFFLSVATVGGREKKNQAMAQYSILQLVSLLILTLVHAFQYHL